MSGCSECLHCEDDPGGMETLLPGLVILSSAYGSSRGDTALCLKHDVFLRPGPPCSEFQPRTEARLAHGANASPAGLQPSR